MSSSPPPTSPRPATSPSPDPGVDEAAEEAGDLPLTMAASVMLSTLPRDAHEALEKAGDLDVEKVTIKFSPLPSAPPLRTRVFKISASRKFETVVRMLRKKLQVRDSESVFCYVNNVFAPGLDEGVGNLWRCFGVGEDEKRELVVSYSVTAAFG